MPGKLGVQWGFNEGSRTVRDTRKAMYRNRSSGSILETDEKEGLKQGREQGGNYCARPGGHGSLPRNKGKGTDSRNILNEVSYWLLLLAEYIEMRKGGGDKEDARHPSISVAGIRHGRKFTKALG